MLPLRHASRWRIAGLILLVVVFAATLMPSLWFWPQRPQFTTWLFAADKWLHGVTFALLAVWFAGQYRKSSYWRIALGLLAFGILVEACQRLVTYRSSEWFDVVADAVGIIIGLSLATAGLGGWSLRVENYLVNKHAGVSRD